VVSQQAPESTRQPPRAEEGSEEQDAMTETERSIGLLALTGLMVGTLLFLGEDRLASLLTFAQLIGVPMWRWASSHSHERSLGLPGSQGLVLVLAFLVALVGLPAFTAYVWFR
jgi:hypothetical protein